MKQKYKRTKTPTILQMEAVECGAASLAIVLAHYGKFVPLERLRIDCGVSRDGSKATNILKAAREYGLEAKGYKYDPEDLYDMQLPLIVFWNFNHFLVVEGFSKEWVFLNDPESGPRKVSHEEFNESFTGVVLSFQPGPDFKKEGQKQSLLKSLAKRVKGSEMPVLFAIVTGALLVVPGLIIPLFTRFFIDEILIQKFAYYLPTLVLLMIATGIVLASLTWLQQRCLLKLETKLSVSGSSSFFMHILKLPVEFFEQRFAGDISSRVSINDRVAQLLSRQLSSNFISAVMVVFYLILLFMFDPVLTAIGLCVTALNIALLKYVSRKRVDGNMKLLQDRGKLIGASISGFRYIETSKASGAESDLFTRWSGYLAKVINGEQELNYYTQVLSIVPAFLNTINTVIILTLGSVRVMNGAMTVGELIAYQFLMTLFQTPINNLMNLSGAIQEVEGDIRRIDDVLDYRTQEAKHGIKPATGEGITEKLNGSLELRDITFGYSPLSPPLIENFSLTLKPGSRVAIVGKSGSGKSTLSRIICGLYRPWKGEILLDGKPMDEIQPQVINNTLSMVDQSIMLFEGTVRENITMWDQAIDNQKMIAAAKDACIHDEIAERANGYDTWFSALNRGIAEKFLPPRKFKLAEEGEEISLDKGEDILSFNRTLWIQNSGSDLRFMGREELSLPPGETLLPVSDNIWLKADEPSTISALSTAEFVSKDPELRSLAVFHETFVSLLRISLDSKHRKEEQYLIQKEENKGKVLKKALTELALTIEPGNESAGELTTFDFLFLSLPPELRQDFSTA